MKDVKKLHMKRILITGSNGFIGKNIVEGLKNKYIIDSLTSEELDLTNTDKTYQYFKMKQYECIIHTALYNGRKSGVKPERILENNLRMYMNLLNNQDHYNKMIYFGSGAEFDKNYCMRNVNEDYFGKKIPKEVYGFTKYVMQQCCNNKDKIINLRLFGVYGKYEDYHSRFISNACCRAIYNKPITINQNVVFSYLYIEDLIKVLPHFIENAAVYKDYNVVPNEKTELVTIAKIIKEISGKKIPIIIKKEGMNLEYTGSNNRLISQIGDFKFTPMNKGIQTIYSWYEKNRDLIDEKLL